jgi:heterodisulfide reductase subunit C
MLVEHRLEIVAVCPVDKLPDVYACIVRCSRVVKVEDILAAVEIVTKEPAYQETLTQELHRRLACEVETTGWHSGVLTRVVCASS